MHHLTDPKDPRPLLPVIAVWGLVAWKLPLLELLLLCAACAIAATCCLMGSTQAPAGTSSLQHRKKTGSIIQGILLFALGWAGVFFLIEFVCSEPPAQAALNAGTLALRLLTVSLLGLWLIRTASPRALSLSLSWYLRPILGKKVWEAALALGLMIHFLPLALSTLNESQKAVTFRIPHCPVRRRIILIISMTLRRLAQKSWDQATAVASRHLDRPEVWFLTSKPAVIPMLKALFLCLLSLGLLWADDFTRYVL